MSDPVTPVWVMREFELTTPFVLKGELEYQSWDELERTLTLSEVCARAATHAPADHREDGRHQDPLQ